MVIGIIITSGVCQASYVNLIAKCCCTGVSRTWLASLILVWTGTLASAQIGGLKPAAGAAAEGVISVASGSDVATEIPITVMRGGKPGPTLAVIAGLDGTAYAPIAATYLIANNLKLEALKGTIVVVHIANLPAYVARSMYVNPVDHKDLSRVFPGKADGTQSERIAYAITTQVIEKSDYVIDLAAVGSNTALAPHVYQAVSGDSKVDAKIAAMTMAFGINYIVTDRAAQTSKVTLESAALAHLKPVLKVMCGSFGIVDNRTLEAMTKGISSVMSLFEMNSEAPAKTRVPVFFDHVAYVDSPGTGMLSAYVQRGQNVHKGEPMFSISSYHAKDPQIVSAPIDGIVISMMTTPPVSNGEAVALIGTPRE